MPSSSQTENASSAPDPVPHARPWRWWLQKLTAAGLFFIAGVLLIASLGLAQRLGWITGGGAPTTVEAAAQIHMCPMHPQIRQPGPGRCSICGMELVPAAGDGEADLNELSVKIEPAQRRLANIETADVQRAPLMAQIETVGAIAIDESRMKTIPSYIDGRIERLFADYTGVDVEEDDHLAVVYSPELFRKQVDYLEARRLAAKLTPETLAFVRETNEKLVVNTRQRLIEFGMTEDQVAELEESGKAQSRLTIYSTIGGTVIEKLAVEGKYVEAGEPIYRIADLQTVWLMLELYPEDAVRIRFGQRVEAEMQSLPGDIYNGRVAYIDRTVDAKKRTVGVRVEFLNDDKSLRPGDYARATIHLPIGDQGEVYDAGLAGRWISPMHPQIIRDEPGDCPICGMKLIPTSRFGYSDKPLEQPASLYIPRSALLMAGTSSVVYVEVEEGRFEIRPVVLGPLLRDKVVVLGGLKEGERVATAGNFLIDSQMQIAGKPSLIDPTRAIAKQQERKVPLSFEDVDVAAVAGENGAKVEALYEAYFAVQKALAGDSKPPPAAAMKLHQAATELAAHETLPTKAVECLKAIAEDSEHLHHQEIDKARESFKPVSHATVRLATLVRGETAEQPFTHFFCPMVKGGGGDWLQADRKLINPYWGSRMLTCGDKVNEFPIVGQLVQPAEDGSDKNSDPADRRTD